MVCAGVTRQWAVPQSKQDRHDPRSRPESLELRDTTASVRLSQRGATVNISRTSTFHCLGALILLTGGSGLACATANQRTDNPAPSADDTAMAAEQVPAAIRVPSAGPLLAHFHATGAQVYTCGAAAGGAPAWALKAPAAKLFDTKGNQVGTHGEGPNWTSTDGSSVRGKKIAEADAPRADSIPWLLVQATAHEGEGLFSKVEYIQRVNTVQGRAPTSACDAAKVGAEVSADYSADYYFYGGAREQP